MGYRAIVLDVDGTLVDDTGVIRPRTLERLREAAARGVRVMLATGRSEMGVRPILEELRLDGPAVVFNGAGVYCPLERRLLSGLLLEDVVVRRAHAFAREADLLMLVSRAGEKFAGHPRNDHERSALKLLEALQLVPHDELPLESVMRVTLFSGRHARPEDLADELVAVLGAEVYLTWFPLRMLADHRDNALFVADVQPACAGKGEALRLLEERFGIRPEEVVAVGDAQNDVPMLSAAGLGVAMRNGMPSAIEAADRVIGDNNSDALAELIEELFLDGPTA